MSKYYKRKPKGKPRQRKFDFAKGEPPKPMGLRRLLGKTSTFAAFHELGDKLLGEIHYPEKAQWTSVGLVHLSEGLNTKKPLGLAGASLIERHYPLPLEIQERHPKILQRNSAMVAYGLNKKSIKEAGFKVREFQRKGLPSRMVKVLEKKARERGVEIVWAQTKISNAASRGLLKKLGYREVPTTKFKDRGWIYYYKLFR